LLITQTGDSHHHDQNQKAVKKLEHPAMSTLFTKVKKEAIELLPIVLFFLVSFELLALTNSLMLMQYGINRSDFFTVAFLALIVAKVVAIADHIPAINRFPDKPLIYNVVWKTLVYCSASIGFRLMEKLFHLWRQTGDLSEAWLGLDREIVWPLFWGVSLWLFVLLFVFSAFRELVRTLGREQVFHMFFTNPTRKPPEDCNREG
jgi:hypothetical protein